MGLINETCTIGGFNSGISLYISNRVLNEQLHHGGVPVIILIISDVHLLYLSENIFIFNTGCFKNALETPVQARA